MKSSISDLIKLHNSLTSLTLTSVLAFLGYLISNDNSNYSLFFLPIPLIIAVSTRVLYYRKKIVEIGGYIIAVLEPRYNGLQWETYNNYFENISKNAIIDDSLNRSHFPKKIIQFIKPIIRYNRYFEFLMLIIACWVLYTVKMLPYFYDWTWKNILIFSLFIISVLYEIIITVQMNNTNKYRTKSVNEWKKISEIFEVKHLY